MRSKITALGTAAVLAGAALAISTTPAGATGITAPAGAPRAGATAPVPRLQQSPMGLSLAGATRAAALQTTSGASPAAVTFVDEDLTGPAALEITVRGSAAPVGQLQLTPHLYTEPQLLPSGTYTVTATDPASGATVAENTLNLVAGTDTSEVFSGGASSAGTPGVQVEADDDAVGAIPARQGVLSVRNTTQTPLDVYLNGSLAVADGTGPSIDLPAGVYDVSVVRAGTPDTQALYTGFLALSAASYVPLYLVSDPSQAGGIGAGTTPFVDGYQYTASDGGFFNYGAYPFEGSTGNITLSQPIVGGAEAAGGGGYWLAAADGGVFAFGAPFLGSLGNLTLNAPIVGMAATVGPDGQPGYLLVARDGGVFAFDAPFYGSLGGSGRDDIVGIAADPSTGGYVIAEANGSYSQFGPGLASTPTAAGTLNQPIVGITETPDGGGAWLVAADGGVFTVGDAPFEGSTGAMTLNRPVVGLFPTFDGLGYDLIAADGGVFSFGDARFYGSTGNVVLNRPIVGAVNP